MDTILNVCKIKPGQLAELRAKQTVNGYFAIPVTDADNGILLMICAEDEGSSLTFLAGDGVLAGKDETIPLNQYAENLIYLETGRYLHHEGEYKGHMVMYTSDEYVTATAIQLI